MDEVVQIFCDVMSAGFFSPKRITGKLLPLSAPAAGVSMTLGKVSGVIVAWPPNIGILVFFPFTILLC